MTAFAVCLIDAPSATLIFEPEVTLRISVSMFSSTVYVPPRTSLSLIFKKSEPLCVTWKFSESPVTLAVVLPLTSLK